MQWKDKLNSTLQSANFVHIKKLKVDSDSENESDLDLEETQDIEDMGIIASKLKDTLNSNQITLSKRNIGGTVKLIFYSFISRFRSKIKSA